MNVLVTGGTGFVGQEVVRALHAGGYRIHLLVRDPQAAAAKALAAKYHAQLHTGDLLDPHSIQAGCEGVGAVVHLVGIISEVGDQTFESVHTQGTQNVIAAARCMGVRRFVHMSALGTRANAAARYHRSKWAAEEIVRRSGLEWTIFRPSIIYGPGDQFVNFFARIARRSPIVPVIGHGRTKFQPIPVADAATAFAKSVSEPRSLGQTYDLCGTEVLTLNEIIEAILVVIQRRRVKLRLPFPLAWVQAALLELLFRNLLRKPPPLNRDQVIMLKEDNVGNASPALDHFHLNPAPFRAGIHFLRQSTTHSCSIR